jgi:hypothetical protein
VSAVKQLEAETVLKDSYLSAYGALRHTQLIRCKGETL